MNDVARTQAEADAINDEMVRRMEERRRERPDRRERPVARVPDRRRTCSYCYQPGDHPTPAHCLRALERAG